MTTRAATRRCGHAAAVAALVLVTAVYCHPLLFLGRVRAGNDVLKIRDPFRALYVGALREGRLALWSPEAGTGLALFAESQMGQLYPLHLAVFSVLDGVTGDLTLEVLRCFLAGLFTYALACGLGIGTWGAVLAAVVFMTSGFFSIHREHMWAAASGVHLPLGLLLAERFAVRGRPRTLVWLAALVGVGLLVGHYQLMFLTALLIVPYGMWRLWQERDGRRALAGGVGLLLAVAAGGALAAVQLIPSYEMAGLGRMAVGRRYLTDYSAPVFVLASYGSPWLFDLGFPLWNTFGTSPGESLGYVGLLPLGLAFVAWRGRRGHPAVRPLAAGAVVFTLLSFGRFLPGYGLLLHLPGFGHFRAPGRAAFCVSMCLALLAGVGLTELAAMTGERLRRAARRLLIALAIVSLAALLFRVGFSVAGGTPLNPYFDGTPALHSVERWAWWAPFGLLSAAAAWSAGRWRRVGRWCIVAVAAADLAAFGTVWDRRTGGTLPRHVVTGRGPVMSHLPAPGSFRVAGRRDAWPMVLGHRSLLQNTSFGVPGGRAVRRALRAPFSRAATFYRLMGVRFIVTTDPIEDERVREVFRGPDPDLARLTYRRASETFHLYEVRGPVSRAHMVDATGAAAGTCRIVRDGPVCVEIAVSADRPGRLILADAFYPGWLAWTDGVESDIEPVPLLGSAVTCRMVRMPAGEHVVRFAYRPRSFRRGAANSLVTALVLGVTAAALAVRRWSRDGAA